MKMMLAGFAGWARLEVVRSGHLRVVDTGITVLGTLLVAVSLVIWHG